MKKSLTIENYKGIKKLEVSKLAPFTLVGGRNDVGKSSILEAIFLFYDRQNPNALMSHLGWRGVQSFEATPDSLWAPAFHLLNTADPIVITMVDNNNVAVDVKYRLVRDHVPSQSFTPFIMNSAGRATLQTQPSQVAIGTIAKQGTQTLQDTYTTVGIGGITTSGTIQRPQTQMAVYLTTAGRSMDTNSPARLTQLVAEERESEVLEVARLIDSRIEKLEVGTQINGVPFIQAKITGLPRHVPLSFLGGGMGVAVNMILAILATKDGTVLIDELEIGIHHSVLVQLIDALTAAAYKQRCQIIATTHSYECIKAAFEVYKERPSERFSYFRMERTKDGKLSAKTYPSDALEFALNSEWEVR